MNTLRYLFIAVCSLTLASCHSRNSETYHILSEVSEIIETDYEQAFRTLESLDRSAMSRQENARFCLLMSMALDKKYIDLTSDSLITPAVRYYAKHGKADDKLKATFYYARILENSGDSDSALDLILKGEDYIAGCEDHLFVGRYYMKKSEIFSKKFEWEKSLQAALKAEYHSRLVDDYRGIATALLTASTQYGVLNAPDSAAICLTKVKDIWDEINDYRKGEYYRLLLTYSLKDDTAIADRLYTEIINSNINPSYLPYIAITDYFIFKGQPDNACESLMSAVSFGQTVMDSKEYELRRYKIYALSGDYQNAYESMQRYYFKLEEYEHDILTSDVRILEERLELTKKEAQSRYRIGIATLIGAVSVILSIVALRHFRKRKHSLDKALNEAKEEKRHLEELIDSGALISQDMKELLSKRINVLNDALLRSMIRRQKEQKDSLNELEALAKDKDGFMLSLALQYSISHPSLITHLRDHGLTDWEIGFCCLYILGLSGKDISGYVLSSSNVYNISSRIRQKLGLTAHDTNLSKYLQSIENGGLIESMEGN